MRALSSDAIDIDVCRNVLVKDCYMSVNDDAVVLKGGKGPYADKDSTNGSNEFILIEDCTYGFCHGCLTCGSESIHNRNVILRRIRVDDGQRLLWLKMRPDTPQLYEYISVENITGNVRHFVYIHPWTQYFDLQDRQDIPMSYARNITMSDCKLDVETFFNVEKSDQYELSGFCFRNLDITAKDPDCKRSYVNPFIMENVVVNGKDIGKTQGFVVNYDENKVPQYTLEDPLRFADGRTSIVVPATADCRPTGAGRSNTTPGAAVRRSPRMPNITSRSTSVIQGTAANSGFVQRAPCRQMPSACAERHPHSRPVTPPPPGARRECRGFRSRRPRDRPPFASVRPACLSGFVPMSVAAPSPV